MASNDAWAGASGSRIKRTILGEERTVYLILVLYMSLGGLRMSFNVPPLTQLCNNIPPPHIPLAWCPTLLPASDDCQLWVIGIRLDGHKNDPVFSLYVTSHSGSNGRKPDFLRSGLCRDHILRLLWVFARKARARERLTVFPWTSDNVRPGGEMADSWAE